MFPYGVARTSPCCDLRALVTKLLGLQQTPQSSRHSTSAQVARSVLVAVVMSNRSGDDFHASEVKLSQS